MKYKKADRKSTGHVQRPRRFELRLSDEEHAQFLELEKALGMNRADIVRIWVLQHSKKMLVNTTEIMKLLDSTGTEIGRSGNKINKMAKQANILQQQGILQPSLIRDLATLFTEYIQLQRRLERTFRYLLRLIRRQA